jgi:G3E family GTPase
LVEASGVSNPGALAEIFLGLQKNRVLRVDAIAAVIDAERFPWDRLKTEPLARDQVLASDVVVLNKVDLVDADRIDSIETAIRGRVPQARIIRATRANVPAEVLLGIGGARGEVHAHSHGEFQGFAFRGGTLSFKRLADVIRELPPTVVRIKGIISVVERPGDRLALHVVGRRVHVETIASDGETESQIVFIGTELHKDELQAQIASCEARS